MFGLFCFKGIIVFFKSSLKMNTLLIDHIKQNHQELVELTCFKLERLINIEDNNLYDTGLWFNDQNYLTIIFKQPCESDLKESVFSIGVYGAKCRKLMNGSKYIACCGLGTLDRRLNQFLEAMKESKK